ncbi:MAG TPA: hypothetical protein VJ826_09910 [Candidatus Polarisedimenticolaceae bacterium]|nr:hypothetical protein [Candidatus Polarisedimenticolaceae bacterium]
MRELAVAGLLLGALALLALDVFGLHDRSTLTSPPEAVAEEFVRRIAANRPERARDHLSARAKPEYPAKMLARWFGDVESVVDPIDQIEGKDPGMGTDEAWATVAVGNDHRKVEIRLSLVRERGEWRVDKLPSADEFSP